jgi:hypothetical protein
MNFWNRSQRIDESVSHAYVRGGFSSPHSVTIKPTHNPVLRSWQPGRATLRARFFRQSSSGDCSLAVDREVRSLFFPDIELSRYLGNACAAALFDIPGGRIAVLFEKDPDIGQITGRRVRI